MKRRKWTFFGLEFYIGFVQEGFLEFYFLVI